MFETLLETLAENEILASLIVLASAIIVVLVILKPLLSRFVLKTKTKKDDELMKALYGAIEEHKEEVEAVHKVAKKVKEKKCQK